MTHDHQIHHHYLFLDNHHHHHHHCQRHILDDDHHHDDDQASGRIVDFQAEGAIPDIITDAAAWHNGQIIIIIIQW